MKWINLTDTMMREKVDTGYLLYGSTIVSTVKVRTVITLGDERQQCT